MKFIGKKCPVCEKAFEEDDDIVVCPKCGAPYHRECYAIKGKCIFPELHKSGDVWRSPDAQEEKTENDSETITCSVCGHVNTKDSIVCEQCGEFLGTDKNEQEKTKENIFGGFASGQTDGEKSDNEDFTEGMYSLPPGIRIGSVFPQIKPDEDFDGVSAMQLIKCVGQNALYYLPIFQKIRDFNTSRFNFAAFIFGGPWYLYRKQYLKGTLITLLTIALNAAQLLVTYFYSGKLWAQAYDALGSAATADYSAYFNWISTNCSSLDMFMMLLPYLLSALSWVVIIVCGFTANRSYYNFTLKKIKKIRRQNADLAGKELLEKLKEAGGVNNGLAFMLIACELILTIASMFFNTAG